MYKSACFTVHRNIVTDKMMLPEQLYAVLEKADNVTRRDRLLCRRSIRCWMLNKDYQGKGYAYEAAHAFFDYLFKDKGARRIYAYTEDYNTASQHLCEKLGMRREGLFL